MAASFTEDGSQGTFENLVCSLDAPHALRFIAAVNIFLSVATSLGNTLIIVALQKESSLHPPSKLLYICLSATDLCVGLILQPFYVIILISEINGDKELCYHVSTYFAVIGAILFGVSLSTLTAISVDRLLALLLMLRYRQVVTLKRIRVVVAMIWFLFISVATTYFWVQLFLLWFGYILITVCIITSVFSYTKIYFNLRRQMAQILNHASQGQAHGGGTQLNIALYKKTVSTALWIQLTLVACFLLYGIYTALIPKYGSPPSFVLGGRFVSSLVFLNSSLNPFLYCWKMREVRQGVKDTIRQFWCFSNGSAD
ncbi:hypothetical protein ACROYT_G033780 [Oculina patagonica]